MGLGICCPNVIASPTGTLSPYAEFILQKISEFAQFLKIAPPDPISTCRSFSDQLELQRRWDRGDREGLAARPADPENSKHTPGPDGFCRAFDLGNDRDWLKMIAPRVIAAYPGVVWGGNWIPPDYPHFQVFPPMQFIGRFNLTRG